MALKEYAGGKGTVRVSHVRKNNGILLTGISLIEKQEEVTPTVYLEDFYERYKDGADFGELMSRIIHMVEKKAPDLKFDLESFSDFNKAKDRIVFKLISMEKNRDLLKEVPYIPFLDMAMVFYYLLGEEKLDHASILIYEKYMERWGVGTAQLYEAAKDNTPRLLPGKVFDMNTMMREILAEHLRENGMEAEIDQILASAPLPSDGIMYVLTNTEKYFGACALAYPGMVAELAEKLDADLYVLPSSVHEVILLPADSPSIEPEQLRTMVKEVNATQVAPEEVLSDSVYYYDRKEAAFHIISLQDTAKSGRKGVLRQDLSMTMG